MTGPRDESFTASAASARTGAASASNRNATTMSIARLKRTPPASLPVSLYDPSRHVCHVIQVLVGHPRVERQADRPLVVVDGHGEIVRSKLQPVPVVRMEVNGDEMDADADPHLAEEADEFVAIDAEPLVADSDHEQMPGVPALQGRRGKLDLRDILERPAISPRERVPPFCISVEAGKLGQTETRLDVRHVVLEA